MKKWIWIGVVLLMATASNVLRVERIKDIAQGKEKVYIPKRP